MAYTTINKSTDYFNTKLYTGNGGTQSITGVGHQPDWVWIKRRDSSGSHILTDAVRGTGKIIESNSSGAEFNEGSNGVSAFNSDGFSIGNLSSINTNSGTFASWNWKAGGGQGSSNTDGSINTTYTSVNTTAGFSISQYVGNATSGATVGHGLGTTPGLIFVKKTSGSDGWGVYHHKNTSAPATEYLRLDSTAATSDNLGEWNDTAPTSTVFTIGNSGRTNDNGVTYIAYCFAEKTGYSKFGSYTGNGNANGTFIYTGFKPAFFLLKKSSASGDSWTIIDNKRQGYNPRNDQLYPNSSNTEYASDRIDIVSNGIKINNDDGGINASGATYIYMAIGQSLVGSNNVPCTAR